MQRLMAGAVAASLLLAGCGAKKDDSARAKSTSTTGPTTTLAPSTTVDPATPNATGTGQGATAATQKSAGGGQAGAAGSRPSSGSSGSGAGTSSGSGSGSGSAAAAGKVSPTAPGNYTYNRSGQAHTSAFGDQSLDGPVSLKVDPAAGADQHSTQSGPEGSTEQVVRFLDEGAYFADLKQSRSGITKEFKPNPAVLAVPSAPTVGRTWSWTVTSTDGATTLNASFKVLRNETLTIGGEQVPTVVLNAVLKGSGDITFTTDTTNWVSLAKGLIVRADEKTDGTIGSVTFNSQSTMALTSTKPQ
ncbi:MAG: hypothetical protein QOI20_2334 [Acidimicrobiaceae bacterium]|jgi:hypothetical protein|nr:hypothetical protein [Acidimicrobiaceae bacterium]